MTVIVSILMAALVADIPASPGVYGPPAPAPASTLPSVAPWSISRDVQQIQSEIREGREDDQLSQKQAKELRREAGEIRTLEDRFAQGGLSDSERAELRNRTEVLRAITNAKRSGVIK